MQFKIFTIPTTDDGSVAEEMKRFIAVSQSSFIELHLQ